MSSEAIKTNRKQAKIYSVALRQYTGAMTNRLEGKETYEDIDGEYDVIRLIILLKSIVYYYESKYYPGLALHMKLRKFYSSNQSSLALCNDYF